LPCPDHRYAEERERERKSERESAHREDGGRVEVLEILALDRGHNGQAPQPVRSELLINGTCKTVKARFWPWQNP